MFRYSDGVCAGEWGFIIDNLCKKISQGFYLCKVNIVFYAWNLCPEPCIKIIVPKSQKMFFGKCLNKGMYSFLISNRPVYFEEKIICPLPGIGGKACGTAHDIQKIT